MSTFDAYDASADDNLAVAELELPRRVVNMLDNLGIVWFRELDETDLDAIPGIGPGIVGMIWRAIDRRRLSQGGRQSDEPTLDEIAERTAEVQERWTDEIRLSRAGVVVERYAVPVGVCGGDASEFDD